MSVHLLLGPEVGAKEGALRHIRDTLRTEHAGEVEIIRFYPFECEGGELTAALLNTSLFSDHRLVILSQAESASAALVDEVASYLARPAEGATLVIISSELFISSKISKLVPKANTQTFYDLLEREKGEWIRTFFRRMGLMISTGAVDSLIDISEDNTQELRTICSQLGLFWQIADKGRPIEEEDVDLYVFHSRQEDAFTLFPLIARGELRQSLKSLSVILGSGESQTPILLLRGLLWQFRRLLSLQELLEAKESEFEAFAKAKVMEKDAAIRKPKDKSSYRDAASRFNLEETQAIIAALIKADLAVKEAGVDLMKTIFERLLYQIIVKKGAPLAEAQFAAL
ncbi:MAG: DNA polymerase III subunit delta [Sphaerochaeta sp.]|jgi:DNA polymerase-3 subunit delta|nr:DNA polymerase III subunit delta [Sphaerochaeta sp.]MDX9914259.1 DNA polymerase III subunit delta [Sphaerochaeta sp.]